jgi:imidazolonepropionase-like amidohydrolase
MAGMPSMNKLLLMCTLSGAAAAQTIAITNARIFPVSSPPIESGTLLIRHGKIAEIGPRVNVPKGAQRIDGAGLSIYPGWIDGLAQVGILEVSSIRGSVDTAEIGAFNPQAQAWVAVNPHSDKLKTARVNGVTTALVYPAGGTIGGAASVVNLLGQYPKDMVLVSQAGLIVNMRPPRQGPPDVAEPSAARLAEHILSIKSYLREAKAYAEMRARQGAGGSIELPLEGMLPYMRGERPVIAIADMLRDIRAAVDLSVELGLKLIIAGGAEAWKAAALLKEKNVGVLYDGVHALPLRREDDYDLPFTTPEILRRAGVKFAIVSGSSADSRNLPYRAAQAAAYGLEREDALRSITQWPAELLGISGSVGTLEPGKVANVLISRGDPLDIRSEIKYVFVAGKLVPMQTHTHDLYKEFSQ